ncbi:MAG TPA: hypothetical protein VIM96_07535 [Pseudomonadales bacterium]
MNKRPIHLHADRWAWLVLFALFTAIILYSARSTPLTFDSARHALIARNVIEGHGFVVSYPDYTPLTITSSGPTLILPAALIMALTGNQLWVPAFASAILNCSLLGIFLFYLQRILSSPRRMAATTALLLFFFLWYEPIWWTHFIGETSALLCLLIACAMATNIPRPDAYKHYGLIGMMLAFSLLARPMTIPGIAGLGTYLLIAHIQYYKGRICWKNLGLMLAAGLFGLIIAEMPFRFYEAWTVAQYDSVTYGQFWGTFIEAYANTSSSGVRHFLSGHAENPFLINAKANLQLFSTVMHRYGINNILALAIWAGALMAGLTLSLRAKTKLDRLSGIVGWGLFYYSLWFFFLCQSAGMDRYLIHPILMALILITLLCARYRNILSTTMLIGTLCLVMPTAQSTLLKQMITFADIGWMEGHSTQYNTEVITTADFIASHSFTFPLMNCGWIGSTPELEYLLPRTGNFQDCFDVIEAALVPAENTTDPQHAYRWRQPVNFTLVINKLQWRFAKFFVPNRIRHKTLIQACAPQPVYDSLLYQILDCPFEALAKTIPTDRNTPFIGTPHEWLKTN